MGYWKHQYRASLSWESMEFSAFLILAVWTTSIIYLTSGKGELQTTNYFLSPYSYFSACYLISHPSLLSIYFFIYTYFFLLVRNSWCTELITFRYDKAKNLSMNSTNMIFKGWNRSLINLVFRLWMVFNKGFIIRAISKICKSLLLKYAKNCYAENCFIQYHFNPNA